MTSATLIPLQLSSEQSSRLLELQAAFSQVCNALSPVVAQQRCWNRVTLHHLMYRKLREQFPALGSQMICNAIYMVCKMARLVYQSANSPFNVATMGDKLLPTIFFAADCPVHFDSHTLSMKSGRLSIFTLGGRMRFALDLLPHQMVMFASRRVLEITLRQGADGIHELSFLFSPPALALLETSPAVSVALPLDAVPALVTAIKLTTKAKAKTKTKVAVTAMPSSWPDYLQVKEVR